jgi:hypothetical protein
MEFYIVVTEWDWDEHQESSLMIYGPAEQKEFQMRSDDKVDFRGTKAECELFCTRDALKDAEHQLAFWLKRVEELKGNVNQLQSEVELENTDWSGKRDM